MAVPLLAVAAKVAAKAIGQRLMTPAVTTAAGTVVEAGVNLISDKLNGNPDDQGNNTQSDALSGIDNATTQASDEASPLESSIADANTPTPSSSGSLTPSGLAQNAAAITGVATSPQSGGTPTTGAAAVAAVQASTNPSVSVPTATSVDDTADDEDEQAGVNEQQSLKPKLGALAQAAAGAVDTQEKEKARARVNKKIKKAIMKATILNPAFWGAVLSFVVFILFIAAIMSFIGLFTSSSTTVEDDSTIDIPTVNISSGDDDICDTLTTSAARSSAGCDSSSSSSSTVSGVVANWVYYDQVDPNWETNSTWGSSCGQVAYAMILASYSGDSETYIPDYIRNDIFNTSSEALYQSRAVAYVNNNTDVFGLNAYNTKDGTVMCWANGDITWDEIEEICDNGGCVLIYEKEISSSGRHWIVIQSVDGDNFTYADPNGGKQSTAEKSDIATCPSNNGGCVIVFEKIS